MQGREPAGRALEVSRLEATLLPSPLLSRSLRCASQEEQFRVGRMLPIPLWLVAS
jgi:hypothetical protein